MNEITIPLKDFCKELNKMLADGMDYVTLTILEADPDNPGQPLSPSLDLTAFSLKHPEEEIAYGDIDTVDVTPPEE